MSKRRTLTKNEKDIIYIRYNGCCAICGEPLTWKEMTIAHRQPLSRGGTNGIDNLLLACWHCSHAKQSLTMEEFFLKMAEIFDNNREYMEALQ